MKFPTIVKECEAELLSKPLKPLLWSDETNEYLLEQNKFRDKYFSLAFGKCKYKELFIKKFYKPLPKYNDTLIKDNIDGSEWEQKYYLLVRAFKSTGAIIAKLSDHWGASTTRSGRLEVVCPPTDDQNRR